MEPLARPRLVLTQPLDSIRWMRVDVAIRLFPLTVLVTAAWLLWRPRWLGLSPGRPAIQLAFGIGGGAVMLVSATAVQLWLTRLRGVLRVPASGADASLQAAYYLLNAALEEAFFRGLLQGGVSTLFGPVVGLPLATTLYVLYHRLGRWPWPDVLATLLAGLPLGLAYLLLPGPPSLLGVTLAHAGATCGFLGPGPWLLTKLGPLPAPAEP